ncbi:MAG: hypothetical protein ACRDQU_02135 [Pseudonocardiaceae bacterium]
MGRDPGERGGYTLEACDLRDHHDELHDAGAARVFGVSSQASADALATLPAVSIALHEFGLSDVPDVPARPVEQLAVLVADANRHVDETHYQVAGQGLGAVLTELHVHPVSGAPEVRRAALAALAEACIVAAGIARPLGNGELSTLAAKRATEAAELTERPELAAWPG